MNRSVKKKVMPGTADGRILPLEIQNRQLARKAAQEGIVLLKNDENILPIAKDKKIALYGSGASQTIKGGTGSGDVNEREVVSVYQGLVNAGYQITTQAWIQEFEQAYEESRRKWKQEIWEEIDHNESQDKGALFFDVYTSHQYHMPAGGEVTATDTDTAIFVISRVAGEGADRYDEKEDYYLSDAEEENLRQMHEYYENIIILINSGSIIDLGFLDQYQNIKAVLLISQPGMEGGNAVADVISGEVTPSGKLTDTWAIKYENYPNSELFSHNSGDVEKEYYTEGIYVGYRYFDTFGIPVRYPFGYGLSYTEFEICVDQVKGFALNREDARLILSGRVKNIGTTYSGKEVVQFYVSCPQGKLDKEYQRLVGYVKTKELAPQEETAFTIEIPLYSLASYCEEQAAWLLEEGIYGIFAGNSIVETSFAGSVLVEKEKVLICTEHICPLQEELEEIKPSREEIEARRALWIAGCDGYPQVVITEEQLITRKIEYGAAVQKISREVTDYVDTLSEEQLILLATGDIGKAQGSTVGAAGISIPGSAAQTSECAEGLAGIVLADGPAGLRLQREFIVKDGEIVPMAIAANLEGGYLMREAMPEGDTRYQYCTAFPVGTMLAQTWNDEMMKEIGHAVAEEMEFFQVTLWLAPGMNIHRNPLCGRNFEYYSEDPYLSGRMAAAITNGVQSVWGCGTTIKHFACNNQEDNRMGSDSIISERTLREIYLKGFEIAVKTSQPFSIMTSYNLINGIHAANNYDLCTKTARDEWDFHGVIMTDWTTTTCERCSAAGCMRAGNDLIMPGMTMDHDNLREELNSGALPLADLKRSISYLTGIVWISNQMEYTSGRKAADAMRKNASVADRIRDAGLLMPVEIQADKDISYGPYGKWNLLDVYRRKDACGAQPVIVNMHGGGWSYGDKELYQFYCMDLANRGFAVVNYNYRLSPEHHAPAILEDTNAVFLWMLEYADKYQLDLEHIFVVGDSAGGQLASQYLTLLTSETYRSLFDLAVPADRIRVSGVALNCGVYDMKTAVEGGEENLYKDYLGECLKADYEKTLDSIDVCKYITKDFPPAYVMTASHDFLRDMAEPMADLLASKGVPVEYHLYGEEDQEYMGHVFHCNLRLKEAILCNDDECDFFKNLIISEEG